MNEILFSGRELAPSKIVCVGRNYVDHIAELGNEMPSEMVLFMKPNSAVSNELRSTHQSETVHYEGEICFLWENGEYAGIGFGLDLTKRESQEHLRVKGLPWERAKSFDGSAVFSEFVPFDGEVSGLQLELTIDGEIVQNGGTAEMIFKPDAIQKEILHVVSLVDGDIVMTGTPKGVGAVAGGSVFVGRVRRGEDVLIEGRWTAL